MEANEYNAVLLHLRDSTKEFTHVILCDNSNDPETTHAAEVYSAIHQQWRAFCPTPEDPSKAKVRSCFGITDFLVLSYLDKRIQCYRP